MNLDWSAILPEWKLAADGASISRTLRFATFREAWAFMEQVARAAESLDHHPDWRNVYGRVDITLTTHDAGGLTELDLALAQHIDAAASGRTVAGR